MKSRLLLWKKEIAAVDILVTLIWFQLKKKKKNMGKKENRQPTIHIHNKDKGTTNEELTKYKSHYKLIIYALIPVMYFTFRLIHGNGFLVFGSFKYIVKTEKIWIFVSYFGHIQIEKFCYKMKMVFHFNL